LLNSQPMGFYATAQIVRDAQEHGVEVQPVDINHSTWDSSLESGGAACERLHLRHADMKHDIRATHALRLGLREVSGLAEEHGRTIETVRGAGFDSVRDLWLRTRLPPSTLEKLARADTFRSIGLDRRDALWAVRALQRSGDKDDLPLLARVHMPELEPDIALPRMRPGEHVIEDYRHLHLSLKAHPLSFVRSELKARGILRHAQLYDLLPGRIVTVAGLVLVRQRPGDAKAIFMTLEDETGIANTIVWLRAFELYRPIVLGARLISVTGELQNEQGVIHVIAHHIEDLSSLLRALTAEDSLTATPAHADLIKRDTPDRFRHPRDGDALVRMLKRRPDPGSEAHIEVMPKGRNFH
jgi:error-prone DNA polymerase